jgi:serine/threonine-protein kinase
MPPGIEVQRIDHSGASLLKLSGVLNETFEPSQLGTLPPIAALDLSGIARITSPGVRLWCDFVRPGIDGERRLFLLGCPQVFVDQLNLVLNFAGNCEVLTAQLACLCERCDKEQKILVDILSAGASLPPLPACPSCGQPMGWDDPNALRFVARCGAKQLPPPAVALLEQTGAYHATVVEQRPLEIRKLVEPEAAVLRLDGVLDDRFSPERTASGLDGTLLIESSRLQVAPGGVPGVRQLLKLLEKQCRMVTWVDLPVQLVEMIERGQLKLGSSRVHSALLPFYCTQCDDVQHGSVVLADLGEAGAQRPCEKCGNESSLVIGMVPFDETLRHAEAPLQPIRLLIGRLAQVFSAADVEARLHAEVENAPSAKRTHVGDYRLLRPLSAGGMAEVFIAAKEGVEKKVALKVFRRSMFSVSRTTVHMFLKEARLCAQLRHPNIIEVYDVGEDSGDLYMAMEYIAGRDLLAILHRARRIPPAIAVHIGITLANALDYAHTARGLDGQPLNIVHRDVSLQNVLVGLDGRIKLIDFGIALTGDERTVRPKMLAGNARYMSPEQVERAPLDGRSDLFSLAVVMYEVLAGKRLFGRERVEDTLAAVLYMDVPPIAGIPDSLNRVLRQALEKKRDRRQASAAAFAEDLRGLVEELGGRPTQPDLSAWVDQLFRRPSSGATGELTAVDPIESVAVQMQKRKMRMFVVLGAIGLMAAVGLGAALAWLVTHFRHH